jgi:hypothetical protein
MLTEYPYDSQVAAIHKLRVNVKSLSAEARIIRAEEKRAGCCYRNALHLHRVGRLREEARYAQLALAFVRGKPYRSVESDKSKPVTLSRLVKKVDAFFTIKGTPERQLAAWLAAEQIARAG